MNTIFYSTIRLLLWKLFPGRSLTLRLKVYSLSILSLLCTIFILLCYPLWTNGSWHSFWIYALDQFKNFTLFSLLAECVYRKKTSYVVIFILTFLASFLFVVFSLYSKYPSLAPYFLSPFPFCSSVYLLTPGYYSEKYWPVLIEYIILALSYKSINIKLFSTKDFKSIG